MSRLKNSMAIWAAPLALIAYIVLYYAVGRDVSKQIVDVAVLFGSSYIVASGLPGVLEGGRDRFRLPGDQFLLSYWLVWLVILLQRLYIVTINVTDDVTSQFLSDLPVAGAIALSMALSSGYSIGAQWSGGIGKGGWWSLGFAGALVSLVLLAGHVSGSNAMDNPDKWCISTRGVIHGPSSPYRELVVPRLCFDTADGAMGYLMR